MWLHNALWVVFISATAHSETMRAYSREIDTTAKPTTAYEVHVKGKAM
jgi:hypothetical protein